MAGEINFYSPCEPKFRDHRPLAYTFMRILPLNFHIFLHIRGISMNLLPQKKKTRELSDKQQTFLTALFENGGNFSRACEVAGYSQGSIGHLKESLADEIIDGARNILAGGAIKAANKLVNTIDSPEIERGDNIRLQAAESLLNRVGLGKQETHNVNVQAVHGVVLLPPKKEMVVDHVD